MAIQRFEGFDNWATADGSAIFTEASTRGYGSANNANNSLVTPGRFGTGRALRVGDNHPFYFLRSVAGVTYASGSFSGAFKCAAGRAQIYLQDANLVDCILLLDVTTYSLNYNPTGTANDIAVTGGAMPSSYNGYVWNHYEVIWTPSLLEVKVNGTVIHTKAMTSFAGIRALTLIGPNATYTYYDDLVFTDTGSYFGDARCFTQPAVNTISNTGTLVGSAGSAGEALNSADGSTSYIAFSADGQKTMIEPLSVQGTPSQIKAVGITVSSRRSNTDTVTEKVLVKTASETEVGGAYTFHAAEYTGRRIILETDPADASAWDVSKFNALEVGVKRGV